MKKINNLFLTLKEKRFDWILFLLTLLLGIFGLILITDASVIVAQINFNDQFYYLKRQFLWFILGLLSLITVSSIKYQQFKKIALPLLIISFALLIVVLVPGLGIKKLGARRWLDFGFLSFQPTELTKLALILFGASFFAQKKEHSKSIWFFLAVLSAIGGLIMLEPDLGTTIVIIATGFFICFLAGVSSWKLLLFLIVALIVGSILIFSSPYRQERLLTFLKPNQDPQGASYHTQQILLGLGSGGIFGQGIGQGRQKYAYLPEVVTDSIFTVIAEELGFIGATIFITTLALLVFRCLKIANQAPDQFGQLICAGTGLLIGFQSLINLGAMVGIFPLTGIPLPFISYGGSSLLINFIAIGMVLSVSRSRKRRIKNK